MKAYRVAEARASFGTLLDEVERGEAVVVERGGVRFRIDLESPANPRTARPPVFEYVDPDVTAGTWTWAHGTKGLAFRAKRRRR